MSRRAAPERPARRIARLLALSATVIAAAAACGVPTGESSFEQIPADEISPGLAAPATTTTTIAPTTTVRDVSETTAPSTTMLPETFETPEIYFLSRGLLRPIELTVPAPLFSTDLINLLEDGPPASAPSNTDTAVPEGLVNDVELRAGVVTIDLDETVFDRIPRRDQQSAIAQMVFTFVLNLQGAGQALFTLDGSAIAVPRGDNRLTADPVSVDDYANLLVDPPLGTPTATTTTELPTPGDGPSTETTTTVPA